MDGTVYDRIRVRYGRGSDYPSVNIWVGKEKKLGMKSTG